MRLIINADDFGYDDDTTAATIDALERGSLTSASLMARMPATQDALAYARTRPDVSFGAHLTFVCDTVEAPVSRSEDIPELMGADGRFMPSNRVRLLALRGLLPVAQIVREAEAQLALLRDHGLMLTHVDSHGHLHKYAPFRQALAQVLPRFGIRRVRGVQNLFLRKPWRSLTFWVNPLWRRPLRQTFSTTDHFFMPATAGDSDWAAHLLNRPIRGVVEVGVHPGRMESWRLEEARAADELADLARKNGHTLLSWRAVGTG